MRQSGGRGQYGDVWLRVEPNDPGSGFTFRNAIVGGAIPKEYIPAVEQGILDTMQNGVLAGYPLVDIRATLFDGSFHTIDSSDLAFRIAASIGFKEACRQASPILLEPIAELEVTTPTMYLGDIMANLQQRRAKVSEIRPHGVLQIVNAKVPIAEMFGYATQLRSQSQGRAHYSMEFSHYDAAPRIALLASLRAPASSSYANQSLSDRLCDQPPSVNTRSCARRPNWSLTPPGSPSWTKLARGTSS